MQISLQPDAAGNYWIRDSKPGKTTYHGPFRNPLEASVVVIEMIADRAFAKHGHKVYFLEARFK